MGRAWPLILGGACVAPLATALPMLVLHLPRLGLPQYPIVQGIEQRRTKEQFPHKRAIAIRGRGENEKTRRGAQGPLAGNGIAGEIW